MNRTKRTLAIPLVLFVLLIGGLVLYTALIWQQARRDHNLVVAVEADEPRAAQRALDLGANPNTAVQNTIGSPLQQLIDRIRGRFRKAGQMSVLLRSMYTQSRRATRLLIQRGAKPDLVDRAGTPILMDAVSIGRADLVEEMLKRGANPNAANADGDTALMWAANHNDLETCNALLARGANANAQNKLGQTPLIWASGGEIWRGSSSFPNHESFPTRQRRRAALTAALLAHGANINALNRAGNSALIVASLNQQTLVPVLISHKADVNARSRPEAYTFTMHDPGGAVTIRWNNTPTYNRTLLMNAVLSRDVDQVKRLLAHGAKPDLRDEQGKTALHLATTPQIRALLQQASAKK